MALAITIQLARIHHEFLHHWADLKTILAFTKGIALVNFYLAQGRKVFFSPVRWNSTQILFEDLSAKVAPQFQKQFFVSIKAVQLVQLLKGIVTLFRYG